MRFCVHCAYLKILRSFLFDNAALFQLLYSIHLPWFFSLNKTKQAFNLFFKKKKEKCCCRQLTCNWPNWDNIRLPSQRQPAWFCSSVLLHQECYTLHFLHFHNHTCKKNPLTLNTIFILNTHFLSGGLQYIFASTSWPKLRNYLEIKVLFLTTHLYSRKYLS